MSELRRRLVDRIATDYDVAMAGAYLEGRCVRCGQRVTVDREPQGHTRQRKWCGPVVTDHPSHASDTHYGEQWMVPYRRDPS